MNSGIYAIRNTINNKRYIGSTLGLHKRYSQHQRDLKRGKHFNSCLQRAWNKYGEINFCYEIIEHCDAEMLLTREEFWIANLQSHKNKNGYNICEIPRASRVGCKASAKTILKMKKSLGGKNHPNWGKKLSKSHIENISKSQIGIPKPTSGRKKSYEIISPTNEIIKIMGLRKFCKDNQLPLSIMWRIVNGKKENYNGWRMSN